MLTRSANRVIVLKNRKRARSASFSETARNSTTAFETAGTSAS
jgi:hypothetical protein